MVDSRLLSDNAVDVASEFTVKSDTFRLKARLEYFS